MTPFDTYLLIFLDKLQILANIVLIISGVLTVIALVVYEAEKPSYPPMIEEYEKKYKETNDNILKVGIIFLALGAFIKVFVPDTKEMAAIVIIPKMYNAISTNKQLTELPNNMLQLANDWIKELSPNKENK